MAGSDRQHQEEDASAHLHYLSERLYRCGSLLLIGQAYCRRQRASQKPSFLIHLASTAKVGHFRGLNCGKSRPEFYDAETLFLFGFATCALATLASRPRRLFGLAVDPVVAIRINVVQSRCIRSVLKKISFRGNLGKASRRFGSIAGRT